MTDTDLAALAQELSTRIAGATTMLDALAPLPAPAPDGRWRAAAPWLTSDELALAIRVAEAARGWGPSATLDENRLVGEILERAESRRGANLPPPRGR
jgi:hypothetical protein